MSQLSQEQDPSVDDACLSAKARLIESAEHLFAEKGYAGTTVREIIERAGVTRPVLYYYFENKEDLFVKLVSDRFTDLTDEVFQYVESEEDTLEKLRAFAKNAFIVAKQYPKSVQLLLQVFFSAPGQIPSFDISVIEEQRVMRMESVMREGLERGILAGGDAKSLATVFLGMIDYPIMAVLQHPEMKLTEGMADGLVGLFVEGAAYRKDHPVKLMVS